MGRSPQPPELVRVIDDLETLHLLTQPLRLRIVEALRAASGPLAVKDLARVLATSQTKLYYHVNLLEEARLIRVAATRVVSGITEKRYEAATYRLSVDRALLAPGQSGEDGLDVFLSVIPGQGPDGDPAQCRGGPDRPRPRHPGPGRRQPAHDRPEVALAYPGGRRRVRRGAGNPLEPVPWGQPGPGRRPLRRGGAPDRRGPLRAAHRVLSDPRSGRVRSDTRDGHR